MKAVVVEAPGKIAVREMPMPEPGEYEALCELLYGAICSGTDLHLFFGHPPFCHWVRYPFVLGHESIGRVVKAGRKAKNLRPGDLVTRVGAPAAAGINAGWGGFAEYGIAVDWQAMQADGHPATTWQQARVQRVLPSDISAAEATMLITWRETWSFITRMGFRPSQRLLVIGSGGNGLAFANHARNLGAAAVIILGSDKRAEVAAAVGAQLVDYKTPNAGEQLKTLAIDGFDAIIDAVGSAATLEAALPFLKPGGTIAIYGFDDAGASRIDVRRARGGFTFYQGGYDEAESHDAILRFMQAGLLQARYYLSNLSQPFPLTDIAEALTAVKERRAIKALVQINPLSVEKTAGDSCIACSS